MLQQSVGELRLTIEELEKRFDLLDDESKISCPTWLFHRLWPSCKSKPRVCSLLMSRDVKQLPLY